VNYQANHHECPKKKCRHIVFPATSNV